MTDRKRQAKIFFWLWWKFLKGPVFYGVLSIACFTLIIGAGILLERWVGFGWSVLIVFLTMLFGVTWMQAGEYARVDADIETARIRRNAN